MNLTILSLESFHTLHREYKESTSEYVQDIAFVYGQKVFKQVPLRITASVLLLALGGVFAARRRWRGTIA